MFNGVYFKAIRIAIVISCVIVTSASLTFANATPKAKTMKDSKAEIIKCKPSKATAHSPKDVARAEVLPKKMPKTFTFETNCGDIVVTTVGSKAAMTITQLSTLANGKYFDGSYCHRLTTQGLFVLQCGDPTATGSGGPSFTYGDENLPAASINNYPAGTVAMTNSGPGINGVGTNGSQFFLVFSDTTLRPNYTIWGTITKGLDIVKTIAKAGVRGGGADGAPRQRISINRVIVGN
jgi:peptidyl-prolyl cis-trans isomerase B (cyclophilin B)